MSLTINNVTIDGTEDMIRNLAKLDDRIRNEAARDAVEEGADVIMAKAVINSPVRTSALRNSFRVESRTIQNGAEAEVGPHVIYARIQEYGGRTGRGHKTYITGKHYLGRAVDEKRSEVISVMADTIAEYLRGD